MQTSIFVHKSQITYQAHAFDIVLIQPKNIFPLLHFLLSCNQHILNLFCFCFVFYFYFCFVLLCFALFLFAVLLCFVLFLFFVLFVCLFSLFWLKSSHHLTNKYVWPVSVWWAPSNFCAWCDSNDTLVCIFNSKPLYFKFTIYTKMKFCFWWQFYWFFFGWTLGLEVNCLYLFWIPFCLEVNGLKMRAIKEKKRKEKKSKFVTWNCCNSSSQEAMFSSGSHVFSSFENPTHFTKYHFSFPLNFSRRIFSTSQVSLFLSDRLRFLVESVELDRDSEEINRTDCIKI